MNSTRFVSNSIDFKRSLHFTSKPEDYEPALIHEKLRVSAIDHIRFNSRKFKTISETMKCLLDKPEELEQSPLEVAKFKSLKA